MQRLAVIAKLKPDSEERAAKLIEEGPPFDPSEIGFQKHFVFLASDQVVFVFEGGNLNELVAKARKDPSSTGALRSWEQIIEGMPHVAREMYSWQDGAHLTASWD